MIARRGVSLGRLGLGTAPLGGLFAAVSEDDAQQVVEAAWRAGIRYFDTAPLYGFGLAEKRLGEVLRTKPRHEFVVSTKVGRLLLEWAPPEPRQAWKGVPPLNPVFDFSYDATMRSVEESLGRLGLDRLDILLIHDPDQHFEEALAGAYKALDQLRSEGSVKAIGSGMNQAEMLARFVNEADFDCFLLAGRYTLLDRTGARELLPLCLERGIAVIAGGVFNSGILAEAGPHRHYNYEEAAPELIARAEKIKATCTRHGVDVKAAALQFPLRHPAVSTVLTGCRSVSELEENVRLFHAAIPQDLWTELDT
ncbi:MAG TPA: aldo/keto reductase [Candidatus Dormibacteraeota bacterium]|nr:aldo/keto reductase [Candidatus Dormibacteraeota bacterium]